MDKLAVYLVEKMRRMDVIDAEQENLIAYGVKEILMQFIFLLTTVVIGLLLGKFLLAVVYLLLFIPLRSFAGGFHLNSRTACFIGSNAATALVLVLADGLAVSSPVFKLTLALAAVAVILILAPRGCKTRPLDEKERTVYRSVTCVITGVWFIALAGTMLLHQPVYAALIVLAFTEEALLLVGEIIRSKVEK